MSINKDKVSNINSNKNREIVNTFLDNNLRTKCICYCYENDKYFLRESIDGNLDFSFIAYAPFLNIPADVSCIIWVIDTEYSNHTIIPIEKTFKYKVGRFPTKDNEEFIIKANPYSVIIKLWLDDNNNFHSETLYNPDF